MEDSIRLCTYIWQHSTLGKKIKAALLQHSNKKISTAYQVLYIFINTCAMGNSYCLDGLQVV